MKPTNAYFPGSVSVQNSAQSPKRFSFFCFIWKTNLGVSFGVKRRKPVGKCLQAGPPHRPHLPPGPAPDWWVRDLTPNQAPQRSAASSPAQKLDILALSRCSAQSPPPFPVQLLFMELTELEGGLPKRGLFPGLPPPRP